jgi:hypothetical protein
MSMSRKQLRIAQVAAVATVVAASAGVANLVLPSGGSSNRADAGSAVIDGSGNEVTVEYYEHFVEEAEGTSDHEEVRALAAEFSDVEPTGEGPWPFWVVVSPDGLQVRSTGTQEGDQVGSVTNGSTVWADCVATTEFDPGAQSNVGPSWLRIRWPSDEPGTTFANSTPTAPFSAFVYRGYVVPAGHNGAIPACEDEA